VAPSAAAARNPAPGRPWELLGRWGAVQLGPLPPRALGGQPPLSQLGLNSATCCSPLIPQRHLLLLSTPPEELGLGPDPWAIALAACCGLRLDRLVSPCCWRCAFCPWCRKIPGNLFFALAGHPGVNLFCPGGQSLGLKGALWIVLAVGERLVGQPVAGGSEQGAEKALDWPGAGQLVATRQLRAGGPGRAHPLNWIRRNALNRLARDFALQYGALCDWLAAIEPSVSADASLRSGI